MSACTRPAKLRRPLDMRLQAFLARAGASPSRRKAEALISAGRVSVNGEAATLGTTVSPNDTVLLDGRPVTLPAQLAYLALNKPAGYLTTLRDEPGRDRPTIEDLMPPIPGLVPVGRLDAATTGLLLLTNDGTLAHRIAHPSSEIEKEYEVTVRNPARPEALAALAAGPTLEDGKMLPPKLEEIQDIGRTTTFRLIIHEGRNRIIRRACAAVGLDLVHLKRARVGPVVLGDLPKGHHRDLTEDELAVLR
ncbi:MAG TPA: pseudouridine synthase [Rubrobacteraceae bacterium]|nr:pseudouridine synthase [Rubrobacteraceae bacterium]